MTWLETDRLAIRNFRAGDWEALHETISQYQSSELADYDHQWPTSPEEFRKITQWFATGDSYLAVCPKDTGRLVGFVALNQSGHGHGGREYRVPPIAGAARLQEDVREHTLVPERAGRPSDPVRRLHLRALTRGVGRRRQAWFRLTTARSAEEARAGSAQQPAPSYHSVTSVPRSAPTPPSGLCLHTRPDAA